MGRVGDRMSHAPLTACAFGFSNGVTIGGKRLWLWRAVDCKGEVLDLLVGPKREQAAAVRLCASFLRSKSSLLDALVTDKLRSYASARRELGPSARHEQGL